MSLIKEKENILEKAETLSDYHFPCIDKTKETYYVPYSSSKHLEQDTMVYSSNLMELRKQLALLWSDSTANIYSKDILSAIYQCKDNDEGLLEAIDLYNYMM